MTHLLVKYFLDLTVKHECLQNVKYCLAFSIISNKLNKKDENWQKTCLKWIIFIVCHAWFSVKCSFDNSKQQGFIENWPAYGVSNEKCVLFSNLWKIWNTSVCFFLEINLFFCCVKYLGYLIMKWGFYFFQFRLSSSLQKSSSIIEDPGFFYDEGRFNITHICKIFLSFCSINHWANSFHQYMFLTNR